jgi:P-type Cu+ transporter
VDLAHPKGGRLLHSGHPYRFCSVRCHDKFAAAPEKYPARVDAQLSSPGSARVEPAGGVEYSCPMHPQIVRPDPGACSICGMALEPRTVGLEEENPELRDMTRSFWVAAGLALPLLLAGMSDLLPGQPLQHLVDCTWLAWIELALASPVVLWAGWPFFKRGWASVVHLSPSMFTLIATGTGAAYLFSVVLTVAP